MFAGHMDMSAANAALDLRPEAFERIGVYDAIHPLLGGMIDAAMLISERLKRLVAHPFVGTNQAPFHHVLNDVRQQGFSARVLHHARDDVAAALYHAKHNGLLRSASRDAMLLPALTATADIGFIDFDVAGQSTVAVHLRHVFADFVTHAPRRLVGHAQLALQFLRRYAVARRGEKIHGVKPLLKRCMRPLERRSRHRMNVMAAPRASVGGHFLEAGKRALFAAPRTFQRLAVPDFHKVLKAGVVVRETLEKVLNCECVSHFEPPYLRNIETWRTYVKGIIACHHLSTGPRAKPSENKDSRNGG